MTLIVLPMAAAGALAFPLAGLAGGAGSLSLARLAILGGAVGAVVAYDLREHRIPNRIVLPAIMACAALFVGGGGAARRARRRGRPGGRPPRRGLGAATRSEWAMSSWRCSSRSGSTATRRGRCCSAWSSPPSLARASSLDTGELRAAGRCHSRPSSRPVRCSRSWGDDASGRATAGGGRAPGHRRGRAPRGARALPPLIPRAARLAVQALAAVAAWAALLALALTLIVHASRRGRRRAAGLVLPNIERVDQGRPRHSRPLRAPSGPRPARAAEYVLNVAPPAAAAAPASTAPDSRPRLDGAGAYGREPALQPSVAISLLGPLEIAGLRRARRGATRELLAYLALNRDGASRDELVEALWPGQDPRRTRPRFWQSVTEARRVAGDAFIRDGDRYRLDRDRVRLDFDEFERLLAQADRATGGGDERELLERALRLWRGEPLAGCDYAWADGEIRHLTGRGPAAMDRGTPAPKRRLASRTASSHAARTRFDHAQGDRSRHQPPVRERTRRPA
jgi:hypothetical protein